MSLFVLQDLSFPSFLKPWAPVAFFLLFMMDVWALWFSLVLISQGALLFMCFAAELSPSHSTLTFILTLSVPLVFQAQDFYVEMKWEFTSWGRCRIYTYDGIKFSCCDNCWSFYCGIRQGSKRNDDSGQCGRTWLVCRKPSPNPSWTPLVWLWMQIMSHKFTTKHQTTLTCTFIIWTKVLGHPLL